MLFNSFVFLFAFLPIAYAVFWSLGSSQARYVWLTLTGYVFYGYWDARFCLLMAFSTAVSYGAGLAFLRWGDTPRLRRLCLIVPVTIDLLLLGFFKYANFGVQSAASLARALGVDVDPPAWNIILPIGISFYTFHTISYIVDAYRGTITPTRNFWEFASYVSLFSQLVAGPIVRFRQVEADLENLGRADRTRWLTLGVSYFCIGLAEKVLLADTMAAVADPLLSQYGSLSTSEAWLAMCAYSLQLYYDFSGYSTMAMGLGFLFGIRIPKNFNSPYKALDPSAFWRRWHISLSECMRDYLYIAFGGNRGAAWKTYRNLTLTMLIGGLWHGASWTFVAWGAYHALLLCMYKFAGEAWDRVAAPVRQAAMVVATVVGWVFFRATDFGMARALLSRMFIPTTGSVSYDAALALPTVLIVGVLAVAGPNAHDLHARAFWAPRRVLALAAAAGACLAIMLGGRASPFLYFQF